MAQIADAVGGALETISANLEALSNLDGMNFGASAGETFTQVDTSSGFRKPNIVLLYRLLGLRLYRFKIRFRNRRHGYLYRNTLPEENLFVDAQPCRHKA